MTRAAGGRRPPTPGRVGRRDPRTDGRIRAAVGEAAYARGHYAAAREVFEAVALGEPFVEFLTLPASDLIDL